MPGRKRLGSLLECDLSLGRDVQGQCGLRCRVSLLGTGHSIQGKDRQKGG